MKFVGLQLDEEQTVSFFWMRGLPASFQVHVDHGVLYRDLGLRAPEMTARVQREPGHSFKRDVPLAGLPLYTGERMWGVVSPDAASRARFRAVTESPL